MIERQAVKSEAIRSVGHDARAGVLEIQMANGGVYQYQGVTAEAYQALLGAKSMGKHFQNEIRSKYPFAKVG